MDHSVISPNVNAKKYSKIDRSVIMNNVKVGRGARIENTIIDKNSVIDEGAEVGLDKERDRARGFVVSAGGITVVPKGSHVTAD